MIRTSFCDQKSTPDENDNLQTAKRKKEVRGKILEVLASLSETIYHTKAEIRLYTQNQDLRDRSEALYMAILDFVQMAAAYVNKASAGGYLQVNAIVLATSANPN